MAGLNLSAGVKAHSLKNRLNDVYETPPEATEGLLRAENLPGVIWEPCCGPGAIVRLLRASGRMVYATDLVDYQSPDQDESGWDFLMERQLPIGTEAIVMNPPFKNAGEFVEKAIDLCPKVYMLGRLAFLESDRRSAILDGGMLARVHVFRKRLPMMHRKGWDGPKAGSSMAFAWFVWDRNHAGPATIDRI